MNIVRYILIYTTATGEVHFNLSQRKSKRQLFSKAISFVCGNGQEFKLLTRVPRERVDHSRLKQPGKALVPNMVARGFGGGEHRLAMHDIFVV